MTGPWANLVICAGLGRIDPFPADFGTGPADNGVGSALEQAKAVGKKKFPRIPHYKGKGKKPPVIHCIGYQIDSEGSAFLKGLAKSQHGQYRRVTRLAAR